MFTFLTLILAKDHITCHFEQNSMQKYVFIANLSETLYVEYQSLRLFHVSFSLEIV